MNRPFDKAKYEALLEGLEINVLTMRDVKYLNDFFRYDAEYFNKYFVKLLSLIRSKKFILIEDYFEVSKLAGFEFTSYFTPENLNSDNSYITLTSKNIQSEYLDLSDFITIDKRVADDNLSRSKLFKNDVILSYTGEYRRSLVLQEENNKFHLGPNICRIRAKETQQKITPFYLSTFFNSKIGQTILDGEKTLSAQPTVAMSRIRKIPIPINSLSFQMEIKNKINLAHTNLESSKILYTDAEESLLRALGITETSLSAPEKHNIKSFRESFLSSGRLDAEYYQKKYEELAKICHANAVYVKKISEIQTYNARGVQPIYAEDGELAVINSRHILERELDYQNFEKTTLEHWDLQLKARIFAKDILTYTTGANIGRTQIYLSENKALASNHVNILRITGENPVYVAFVLNSLIGRLQTEKLSAGSAQQELYPKDIECFYIPFILPELQQEISEKVQKSFVLRIESERLLNLAKEAVEVAIEKGESEAMKLLS